MTGIATRGLLTAAAVAVAFAAADTYVVVLAFPDMLGAVGYSSEELQRAAPIVSGFLLGYVAMLPLIGRIADLRGRVPVLVAALVIFALGSLVTALAYDMPSMVSGRFLQGLGGGGLVPATLALVADLYPAQRRAVPLGIVSAVQEAGSVMGPLFGALVLAVADWRAIFLINLAVGLVLAAAIASLQFGHQPQEEPPEMRGWGPIGRLPDLVGALLLLITLATGALVFVRPSQLLRDLTWGQLFIPFAGDGRWLTPIGAVAMAAGLLFVVRCCTARRPLVDLPSWWRSIREADLLGAVYLAVALGGVILAFATADPAVELFADQGWWYLAASVVSGIAFVVHLRSAERPLVPRGTLRARPAWGSVLVSFFVGAALIAAVVDIPLFARTTIYRDSQLDAALVLVRFLVALPVGAVVGGYLTRRFGAGLVTAAGMTTVGRRLPVDDHLGDGDAAPLRREHPAGAVRVRLRPGPPADQRGDPGQHRRRRTRTGQRVRRRGPDGGHARRHLRADRDRAAPLLRGPGGEPAPTCARGLRRTHPVQGVQRPARGPGHPAGARGLRRSGGLCGDRRGSRRIPLPRRGHPGRLDGGPVALGRLRFR